MLKTANLFITTPDKIKISYDWYPAKNPKGYFILAHMMPATKESWREFANRLQKEGYAAIAIDLRGHGVSDGGPNGYKTFSDAEHQKGALDIEAAAEFLKSQGAAAGEINCAGASIGANLCLQYLASHPEAKTAILLSAGLDYHGVKTEAAVKKLSAGQKVLFISSRDDQRSGGNNAEMNEKLSSLVPAGIKKDLIIYNKGGHGADILENHPELTDKIIEFLKS